MEAPWVLVHVLTDTLPSVENGHCAGPWKVHALRTLRCSSPPARPLPAWQLTKRALVGGDTEKVALEWANEQDTAHRVRRDARGRRLTRMMSRTCARASPAIRGEIPRLCRGGSNSVDRSALCFTTLHCKVAFG
jgi:hypothetical protein